jgi:hypothetical protein
VLYLFAGFIADPNLNAAGVLRAETAQLVLLTDKRIIWRAADFGSPLETWGGSRTELIDTSGDENGSYANRPLIVTSKHDTRSEAHGADTHEVVKAVIDLAGCKQAPIQPKTLPE